MLSNFAFEEVARRLCRFMPGLLGGAVACAFAAAAPVRAQDGGDMNNVLVDYPSNGVQLGQGWNSFGIKKTSGTCIVFQKAEVQPGQRKKMNLSAVTSRYQLENSLDVSASAKYKSIGGSVEGKGSFAQQSKLNTSYSNVVARALVNGGSVYAAPPAVQDGERVAALIADGNTPDDVNAALGVKAAEVHARVKENLPDLTSDQIIARERAWDLGLANASAEQPQGASCADVSGIIKLRSELVSVARDDPASFRKICGDSYVGLISRGGELSALLTFQTKSLEKQQKISAEMQGSGWNVTASGSLKNTVTSLSKGQKTTLSYHQSGGSGDPLPTNIDELYEAIRALPEHVETAPQSYKIELGSYTELCNWPKGADLKRPVYAAMDALAYRHSVLQTLNEDLKTILDETQDRLARSQGYILGRGVTRTELLTKQDQVQNELFETGQRIKNCFEKADSDTPCEPEDALKELVDAEGAGFQDYDYRARFPVPVTGSATLQAERFLPAAEVRDRIFDFWVRRLNTDRCAMTNDPDVCWTGTRLDELRKSITVDTHPKVLIVSQLGNRDHCLTPNARNGLVDYSTPCSFTNPNQLFTYDINTHTLKSVKTGKCLNVRGGSKKNGADIISYACQGGAKLNDKWTRRNGQRGGWNLIAKHSNKCLRVPDPIKTGRRTVQYTCGNWQRDNWLLVNQ